jgi:hypothetical protein
MVTKKMFDANKNVTKRDVILIKGVYCRSFEGNKERPVQCRLVIVFLNNHQACFLFEVFGVTQVINIKKVDSGKGYKKTWVTTISYA